MGSRYVTGCAPALLNIADSFAPHGIHFVSRGIRSWTVGVGFAKYGWEPGMSRLCPVVSCGVPACPSGDSELESYQIHGVPLCPVVSQRVPVVIPSSKVTRSMVPRCILWCPSLSQW